jgi:hypothetical protein
MIFEAAARGVRTGCRSGSIPPARSTSMIVSIRIGFIGGARPEKREPPVPIGTRGWVGYPNFSPGVYFCSPRPRSRRALTTARIASHTHSAGTRRPLHGRVRGAPATLPVTIRVRAARLHRTRYTSGPPEPRCSAAPAGPKRAPRPMTAPHAGQTPPFASESATVRRLPGRDTARAQPSRRSGIAIR